MCGGGAHPAAAAACVSGPSRPVAIAGGWRGAVGLAPAGAVRLTGTRGGEGLRPEGCCLADSCGPPYGDFAPTGFQCEASEPNFGILEGVNARCVESRRDGLSRRLQRTSITAFVLIVPVLGCAFDSFYNVCPVVAAAVIIQHTVVLYGSFLSATPLLCTVNCFVYHSDHFTANISVPCKMAKNGNSGGF